MACRGGRSAISRDKLTLPSKRALALGAAGAGLGVFVAWSGTAAPQMATLTDEGLPLSYDVGAIERFWSRHPRVVLWRLSQIVNSAAPFLARTALDHTLGRLRSERHQSKRAAELRELLIMLGPAFIKLGQMLSTRPDLLPQPALDELRKLCDNVPPFPTREALAIIREELGAAAVEERFEGLDEATQPVAAASLGQVYAVRLRDCGTKVALKVQRPDMIRAVSLDLFLLRKCGRLVEVSKALLMRLGVLSPRKQFDVDLLDHFGRGSYLELDYNNEGCNQERFINELVPIMHGKVRVPRVFWQTTSRKVLTTEWLEGRPLASCPKDVIQRLVPVGVECFLKQLLEVAFFHSDPHGSNLLVDNDGTLCLIDFGLCAEVPLPDTHKMADALVHLMEVDVPSLLQDTIALGFLPPDVDQRELLQDLGRVFDESKLIERPEENSAIANGAGCTGFDAIERRQRKLKDVSKELNDIFFRYPFLVPDYFALITRALIVLEGIAVVGDPSFDIFQAAYPYAARQSTQLFDVGELWRIGRAAASAFDHSELETQQRKSQMPRWYDPRGWFNF